MTDPLVSIIIPAYQASKFITRTLDSIAAQIDFSDYEVIVVNDHSPDDTWDVIELASKKDPRIRGLNLDANLGPAGARNIGISSSTGKLIAFLDHDDEWLPQKLAYQVSIFKNIPGVDLVFTDAYNIAINEQGAQQTQLFDVNNSFKRSLTLKQTLNFKDVYEVSGPLQRTIYTKCFLLPSTVMVKRSCLEKVNGFNPKRFGTEDIDLWVRLASFATFYCWMKPVAVRYVSDQSLTNMSERRLLELIDYNVMCLTADEYAQLRDVSINNLEKFFRYTVVYYARNNQPQKALDLFKRSLVIGFRPKIALYSFMSYFGSWPFAIAEKFLMPSKNTRK